MLLWVTVTLNCYTKVLAQLTTIEFYPLMRDLGIYLDLIARNFVLLIKLLPDRNSASLTVAIGEASRLTVAFGADLSGFSML